MFNIFLIITVIVFLATAAFLGKKHREQTLYKIAQFNYWRLRYTQAHEGIQRLKEIAPTLDLMKLLEFHKKMAIDMDLNNHRNLGPCAWGMFRTEDVTTMTADEVFLGGVYGLFTKPLSYWVTCTDTMVNNGFGIDPKTPVKLIIFNQYYGHLKSSLQIIKNHAELEFKKYEKI